MALKRTININTNGKSFTIMNGDNSIYYTGSVGNVELQYTSNGYISILNSSTGNTILNGHFGEIINGSTGLAFTDITALQSYLSTNFFLNPGSAAGIFLNVKDFGVKGDGSTDDSDAILNALASFTIGTLFFPDGNYLISKTIKIGTDQTIMGASLCTHITLKPGSNCTMISSSPTTGSTYRVGIFNFRLFGNGAQQTAADWRGVEIKNDFAGADAYHTIHNVDVNNVRGAAFFFQGRFGESMISNLSFDYAYVDATHPYSFSGKGMFTNTWDCTYSNIMGGHADTVITIGGTDNHWTTVSGYGSAYAGVYVNGARNMVSNVEAQDSATYGLYVDGNTITVSNLRVDSWGWNFVTSAANVGATAVYMTTNAFNCHIQGTIVDRKEFSTGHVATGDYVLYCEGAYNQLQLVFQNVKTALFNNLAYLFGTTNFSTNEFNCIGQLDTGANLSYCTLKGIPTEQIGRRVATSSVGAATGDSGMWTKVASVNLGANDYTDFSIKLGFRAGNGQAGEADVFFSGRQQTSGGAITNLNASVRSIFPATGGIFATTSFKILNSGYGQNFDIYAQKNGAYGQFTVFYLGGYIASGVSVTYFNTQPFATIPAATNVATSS
ncbi:MAG: hypothetical protein JWQ09_5862 [Segetibacter sp.]|nr:hypothetical protein [Segetibacter sp.]